MSIIEFTSEIINRFAKTENDLLEYSLRRFAKPPIKGEITKGKIRWRGIRLVQRGSDLNKIEKWLEQRGEKFSPIIILDFTIYNPLK